MHNPYYVTEGSTDKQIEDTKRGRHTHTDEETDDEETYCVADTYNPGENAIPIYSLVGAISLPLPKYKTKIRGVMEHGDSRLLHLIRL